MKIITADERMAEVRGPKILLAGPPGIGKTTQLRTLDPTRTLFVDLEAGDLAVQDFPVDQVRAKTWDECRDLACYLGGPNPALPPAAPYSDAHFAHVAERNGGAAALEKYDTYFVDSITVAARICLTWCSQQPGAFNAKGDVDTRGMYGLLGREMVNWLTQLQHARTKAVVLVGILENQKDDFGRPNWQLQIDGSKAGRELPGIVDQVIAMGMVTFEGAETPVRSLLCTAEALNFPGFIPKDRSGRLDAYEPPNLGALITKLTQSARPTATQSASKAA